MSKDFNSNIDDIENKISNMKEQINIEEVESPSGIQSDNVHRFIDSEIADEQKSLDANINIETLDVNDKKDSVKEPVDMKKEILGFVLYVAGIFLCVFFILHFIGIRTVVNGSSMETTLSNGDSIITEKLTKRFGQIQRFDVIVFPPEHDADRLYIKRVIGLPGETVYIEDGVIYINGKPLEENYGYETINNAGLATEPIKLADDEYFVLGDNRNNSEDSRSIIVGNVKKERIVGVAWLRIYPFNKFGLVDNIKK